MPRILVSVSDKRKLEKLKPLLNLTPKWEFVSTGGTSRHLESLGIPNIPVEKVTGFPEILDGRVKTLHPKIHAGLLYERDDEAHKTAIKELGIEPIDIVVVNLYPFEMTVANPIVTLPEVIENIDIGGPSMLRSAAKNYESVTVVCDPGDYEMVAEEIAVHGSTKIHTRMWLAIKALKLTGDYDVFISRWLQKRLELELKEVASYSFA